MIGGLSDSSMAKKSSLDEIEKKPSLDETEMQEIIEIGETPEQQKQTEEDDEDKEDDEDDDEKKEKLSLGDESDWDFLLEKASTLTFENETLSMALQVLDANLTKERESDETN